MVRDNKGQLTEYFVKNLGKGYTPDSLKFALVKQGYSRTVIEQSLEEANKILAQKAPAVREKPSINYEVVNEEKPKKSFWKWLFGG
jgi:SOS response regulatory protein OraA/RecX